jgi:hypothetical protein
MILPMILGSKKFYFCTFFIIFVASTISPQIWKDLKIDIKYNDSNNHSFIFHPNNRITGYKNGNLSDGTYTGSFIVREEYGVTFLLITWNDKTTDKYLAIHGGTLIYLYNTESAPFFEGTYEDYIPKRPYVYTDILSASSTLREGNIIYSTDNLDKRIGICWAEGVSGHGIGEKIIFNLKKKP